MRPWIGLLLTVLAEAGIWAALGAYCLLLPSCDLIDDWVIRLQERFQEPETVRLQKP